MKIYPSLLGCSFLCLCPLASAFTFAEMDASGGEFGDTIATVTSLGATSLGINTITGQISAGNDREYFNFTIPSGFQLDSLSLTAVDGDTHFFGINSGAVPADAGADFLFAGLVGDSVLNQNLLALTPGFGSSGIASGTLGAGDYSVLFNETNGSVIDYEFTLVTSQAVPEPSSVFLLGLTGLLGLVRRRR